jgi:hypothetical protein
MSFTLWNRDVTPIDLRLSFLSGRERPQSGTKAIVDQIRLCILRTSIFDGGDPSSCGHMGNARRVLPPKTFAAMTGDALPTTMIPRLRFSMSGNLLFRACPLLTRK